MSTTSTILTVLGVYLLLCVVLIAHVCRSKRSGWEKTVWVLEILFVPIGGCLSYLWDWLTVRRR